MRIESTIATGCANFYDIHDSTIIELRLEDKQSGESVFFLHFELEDIDRAKHLFEEMSEVYAKLTAQEVHHVLLCCTCGITTTFFANKLNETSQSLGLDYDFRAMPLEDAKKCGSGFVAVLLAPQVGHLRKSVAEALPNTLVIELPATIFGSYDASAALNLVASAVTGARTAAASDLRMARDFSLSMDLDDAAWRYDGTLELVACYLTATICCVAPQAIFVWCDFLPDMDILREELHKRIPSRVLPDLVAVSDYDGLVLMGELSLCLQRLSARG